MQFKINLSEIRLLVDILEDSNLVAKFRDAEQVGQNLEKGELNSLGRQVESLVDISSDD